MHDGGGHMSGGDFSSHTSHTPHMDPAPGASPGQYHIGQNPNDLANYYASTKRGRRVASSPIAAMAVAVIVFVALIAVLLFH